MKMQWTAVASAAMALAFGSELACAQDNAASTPPASSAEPAAAAPEIAARVNDNPLFASRLDAAAAAAARVLQGRQEPPDPAALRNATLDRMIAAELLYQKAKTVPYPGLNAEIDKRVEELRGRFNEEQAFLAALGRNGMDLESLRSNLEKDLVIRHYVETEIRPKVEIGDEAVAEFYEANPAQTQRPERVRASHILLRVPEEATPEQKEEIRTRLQGLKDQAAAGSDFAELAQANSDDPGTKTRGGDLGFFTRGQMVPEFEQAAFATEIGSLSDIVQTRFGFHVLKVTGKEEARQIPLEEARDRIRQFLLDREVARRIDELAAELRTVAKVEILDPQVNEYRERQAAAPALPGEAAATAPVVPPPPPPAPPAPQQ